MSSRVILSVCQLHSVDGIVGCLGVSRSTSKTKSGSHTHAQNDCMQASTSLQPFWLRRRMQASFHPNASQPAPQYDASPCNMEIGESKTAQNRSPKAAVQSTAHAAESRVEARKRSWNACPHEEATRCGMTKDTEKSNFMIDCSVCGVRLAILDRWGHVVCLHSCCPTNVDTTTNTLLQTILASCEARAKRDSAIEQSRREDEAFIIKNNISDDIASLLRQENEPVYSEVVCTCKLSEERVSEHTWLPRFPNMMRLYAREPDNGDSNSEESVIDSTTQPVKIKKTDTASARGYKDRNSESQETFVLATQPNQRNKPDTTHTQAWLSHFPNVLKASARGSEDKLVDSEESSILPATTQPFQSTKTDTEHEGGMCFTNAVEEKNISPTLSFHEDDLTQLDTDSGQSGAQQSANSRQKKRRRETGAH